MKRELPRGWEWKKLGNYCKIFNGKTPSKDEQRTDGHPVLKIKDMDENGYFLGKFDSFVDDVFYEKNKVKCLKNGDTLILNAAHTSEYVGSKKCFISDFQENVIPTGEWLIVRSSSESLDNHYKHFLLSSSLFKLKIKKMVKGIHLYPKDMKLLDFPIPPLGAQRKIVAILGKVETTKKIRAQTDKLTNQLLQNVFLEMFGDPIKNEKNWSLLKLINVSKLVTVGIVVKPASYYVSEGVPALRGTNIRKNELKLDDLVYISEENNKAKLSKSIIRERDILIVRTGYPGTACIVPKELDGANCIDLIIVRPDENIIRSEYLCNFINYERVLKKILSSQTGSAQKHFNIGVAKKLMIPIPPIEIQNRFISIVKNIETMRRNQMQSKQQIVDCFNVLMQKAFTGEFVV
jgi:type I restriction enzyme S subunit